MTPRWMLALCSCLLTFLWASITRADDDDLAFTPAWLNVGGSVRAGGGGARDDVAIFGELGLAWDPPTRSRAKSFAVSDAVASASSLPAPTVVALPISARVARSAVHAAYRAARFLSDETLDGLASRSRWSGLVPELRVGARRGWDDSARLDVTTSDDWRTSGATHANLWLEARAAFRLDRLMFTDDELGVARLRLAQSEAAQRLALRVVATLGAWQRAWIESKSVAQGTLGALEASVRVNELETTLDVLTGGWFASWRAREAR